MVVATREINKAVKNNPDKFPKDYIIQLNQKEKTELVEIFHWLNPLQDSTTLPKGVSEKGRTVKLLTELPEAPY